MIQIAFQRHKCIGCNSCVEISPDHWVMSRKDGKSYLIKSEQKGDFFLKNVPWMDFEENIKAAKSCPVKIIHVKKI